MGSAYIELCKIVGSAQFWALHMLGTVLGSAQALHMLCTGCAQALHFFGLFTGLGSAYFWALHRLCICSAQDLHFVELCTFLGSAHFCALHRLYICSSQAPHFLWALHSFGLCTFLGSAHLSFIFLFILFFIIFINFSNIFPKPRPHAPPTTEKTQAAPYPALKASHHQTTPESPKTVSAQSTSPILSSP